MTTYRRGLWTGAVAGGTAVAATTALLLGPLASAAVPNSATGVISACRNAKTGAVRVIDAQRGARCAKGERALTWNAMGPRGAQGVPGVQGIPGPATGRAGGALTGTYPNPQLAPAEAPHVVGAAGEPAFDIVAPVLTHAWANYGGEFGPVSFRKDQNGWVHLGGLACPTDLVPVVGVACVQTSSLTSAYIAIFTLPAGYRPATRLLFGTEDTGRHGRLDVLPDGEVAFHWTANDTHWYISLEGISFHADQ